MSHRSGSSAPPPMTASAPRPTPCRPGTPGKVAEMARRAEKGLPLFHPGDAPAAPPGGLPRGVSVHRKAKRYKGVRVPALTARYRAKVVLPCGRQASAGCHASPAEALAAVARARYLDGVAEADALLAEWGWSPDDEDDDAEGGSGPGPWHGRRAADPWRLPGAGPLLFADLRPFRRVRPAAAVVFEVRPRPPRRLGVQLWLYAPDGSPAPFLRHPAG